MEAGQDIGPGEAQWVLPVLSVATCPSMFTHLALARDGLIEEQAAAILVVQAGVFRPCRSGPHAAQAGHSEWLQAVCGERWGRCGRVGLVAGGRPTPVAP